MENRKSLFDDIFRLQNTAPDDDIDPEDPEDGAKARLAETTVDESESLGPSALRKQTAIIADDPRYKGRKTSRKDLYSDDEEDEGQMTADMDSPVGSDFDKMDDDDDDDDSDDEDESGAEESDSGVYKSDEEDEDDDNEADETGDKDDVKILSNSDSDDRKKGKAVVEQLDVWDNLIKSRIVVQKLVTSCNRLPQPDVWPQFWNNASFRQEANNVHSSVRKVMSALLDLQTALESKGSSGDKESKEADGSDEEITSESEAGDDDDDDKDNIEEEDDEAALAAAKENGLIVNDDESAEEDKGGSDIETKDMEQEEAGSTDVRDTAAGRSRLKRKLDAGNVEETLAKRHADFQSYRNDTLSKWDEKTRLSHGKIKSKNFAAFEMSVLKQIEQVLVNRDRLIRRIHQKRSEYRILGKPQDDGSQEKVAGPVEVDDDDDEVELKLKQRPRSEIRIDPEIIDDNDFYHICLRDLIEMKQNEETDPVLANKQWLEIQRLRNKQKQKVDTKASKGRKIRYNVKEKLKNYMTPYDKSVWSEEQKDDLFKALFGGKSSHGKAEDPVSNGQEKQSSSIVLGI